MRIFRSFNIGQNIGIFFFFISLFLNFLIILLPLNFFPPEEVKLFRQILNIANVAVPIFILGIDNSVPILTLNRILSFAKYHFFITFLVIIFSLFYESILSIALSLSIASIVVASSLARKVGNMKFYFFSTQLVQKILILLIVCLYILYKVISINDYFKILCILCLTYSVLIYLNLREEKSKTNIISFYKTALDSIRFGISAAFYQFLIRSPYFLLLPAASATTINKYDLALACSQTIIMPSLMRSKYLDVIDNWSPDLFYREIKRIDNALFIQEIFLFIVFLIVLAILSFLGLTPFDMNALIKSYLVCSSIVFLISSFPNIPFVACRFLPLKKLLIGFIISTLICLFAYNLYIKSFIDLPAASYLGCLLILIYWVKEFLGRRIFQALRTKCFILSVALLIISYGIYN